MRWLLVFALLACSKPKEIARADPPTPSASTKTKVTKPKPAPTEIPPCKDEKDPLSALCTLSADASKSRFECKEPEPIMFCSSGDDWCCKYMAFAGETPPPVTFHARFDHEGPPVKTGVALDMKQFQRKGPIRAVAIHFAATEAAGKEQAKKVGDDLVSWGCEEGEKQTWKRVFDCGSWEAEVQYQDIIKHVIVSAAEKGKLECR